MEEEEEEVRATTEESKDFTVNRLSRNEKFLQLFSCLLTADILGNAEYKRVTHSSAFLLAAS